MLEQLKKTVWRANLALYEKGLAVLTWGNVSAIDRRQGLVVIKPSGMPYAEMEPADMVVVDPAANIREGDLKPSSDLPTHLALYEAFADIGAVAHTHSSCATMFAQARRELPCLGTTHADHFHGPVPVTRPLQREETEHDYETNTGRVITERFKGLDPRAMPAVLVANHGPFTWGPDPDEAVANAVALEAVARMALGTLVLDPQAAPTPDFLLDKHYLRKHGPDATYGQTPGSPAAK